LCIRRGLSGGRSRFSSLVCIARPILAGRGDRTSAGRQKNPFLKGARFRSEKTSTGVRRGEDGLLGRCGAVDRRGWFISLTAERGGILFRREGERLFAGLRLECFHHLWKGNERALFLVKPRERFLLPGRKVVKSAVEGPTEGRERGKSSLFL